MDDKENGTYLPVDEVGFKVNRHLCFGQYERVPDGESKGGSKKILHGIGRAISVEGDIIEG